MPTIYLSNLIWYLNFLVIFQGHTDTSPAYLLLRSKLQGAVWVHLGNYALIQNLYCCFLHTVHCQMNGEYSQLVCWEILSFYFIKRWHIVLKRTRIGIHKNVLIVYHHICMTKYILTVASSFTPHCVSVIHGQTIPAIKVNIHVYSMSFTSSTFYWSLISATHVYSLAMHAESLNNKLFVWCIYG